MELTISEPFKYSLRMSNEDRNKWNQRYAEDSYHKNNPVTLLENWLPQLPVGRALDVACGAGRNALHLAQAGYQVDAIDISAEGLNQARQKAEHRGLNINWIEHDFDRAFQFDTDYDLVIVMWYVNLALITRLCGCLAAGGYLLCEEHLITDQQVIGPGSLNFRVAPGDLREAVSGLDILLYEESIEKNAEGDQVASARAVVKNNQ
jgi:tellurite methyltransferase